MRPYKRIYNIKIKCSPKGYQEIMLHVKGGRRGSGGVMLMSSNEYTRYKSPPQPKAVKASDCAYTNIKKLKQHRPQFLKSHFWWAGSKCLVGGVLVFWNSVLCNIACTGLTAVQDIFSVFHSKFNWWWCSLKYSSTFLTVSPVSIYQSVLASILPLLEAPPLFSNTTLPKAARNTNSLSKTAAFSESILSSHQK